ncbi:MAG: hypothetical protein WD225_07795 [Ilumatobacteraceae bacterium]
MGRRGAIALLAVVGLVLASCTDGDDADVPTTATSATSVPPSDQDDSDADASDDDDDIDDVDGDGDGDGDGDDGEAPDSGDTTGDTGDDGSRPAPRDLLAAIDETLEATAEGCDPLDSRHCYLPWPSDAHTVSDPTSATGRRVRLPTDGAPVNAEGTAIDVSEWNRSDGFSPNTRLMAFIDDLDAEASELPSWTDLGASLDDDATVVIVDITTGERVPLWAEPDLDVDDDGDRTLVIHPAVSLPNGHRFAVALRGLVTTGGDPVAADAVFRSYRDALTTDAEAIEDRRAGMEEMFDDLEAAGIERDDLQLAWTFTTASTENVTDRMLHIRDESLAELGGTAPRFEVTDIDDDPDVETIGRVVTGTLTAPNWLTGDGGPGEGFHYGDVDVRAEPDALPARNGTVEATFRCNVPDVLFDGGGPGHLVQYGHGLLGSEREINASNVRAMSNEHGAVYCATKWAGMSEDDVGNAVDSLGDMSNFSTLTDRLQQGVLQHVLLGRLLAADDGLAAHPALQRPDGTPLVTNDQVVYDGNSQGGIMGLMLAAVSPDLERAVLGVPGMNYSLLLPRSVDFDPFREIFEPAYPEPLERSIIISMIQMLWDRGEGAGYVRHVVSDPFPDTPSTDVLLHVAFGDWQVTELSAFIAARTMEVPIHRPVTEPGRSREVEPGWGLDPIPYPADDIEYPWEGSGLVVWDSGSDPIPVGPVPPSTSRDSHEDPRADPDVRDQKAAFLFDGELVNVCGDDSPCTADPSD